MRRLVRVLRPCAVVEVLRRVGVEAGVELVLTAEFEPRPLAIPFYCSNKLVVGAA